MGETNKYSSQITWAKQNKKTYFVENTISTTNLVAVSAKVDAMNGLQLATSALVQHALAVNELIGNDRDRHG